jgi:hypothetical protein
VVVSFLCQLQPVEAISGHVAAFCGNFRSFCGHIRPSLRTDVSQVKYLSWFPTALIVAVASVGKKQNQNQAIVGKSLFLLPGGPRNRGKSLSGIIGKAFHNEDRRFSMCFIV